MKHVLLTLMLSLSAWHAFAIDGYNGSPADLQKAINDNENVLLIFGASWCGPCQRMKANVWSKKDFQDFTDERNVKRFYIDIDFNRPTAQQYSVNRIPTWFVISEGQIKSRTGSASKSQVERIVKANTKDPLPPPPVFTPFSADVVELENSLVEKENVLLVFGSKLCATCEAMKEDVWKQEQFLQAAKDLKVKKFYVDVADEAELVEKFNVIVTPSFFVVKDGQVSDVVNESTLDEVVTLLDDTFKVLPPAKPYSNSVELLESSITEQKDFILIFGATWCGPCQRMKKNVWDVQDFIDFSNGLGLTRFYFDTDEFGSLAVEYGVTSIPTWFVVKDGQIDSKNSSASKTQVESILRNTFGE